MIESISMAIVNESGDNLPVKQTAERLEIKIETTIADTFSRICFINNGITDQEIKLSEKFHFAVTLNNYLKEMQKNETRIG